MKQFVALGSRETTSVVLPDAMAADTDEVTEACEVVIVVFENCAAHAEETNVERKRTIEVEVKLAMFAAIEWNDELQVQKNVS